MMRICRSDAASVITAYNEICKSYPPAVRMSGKVQADAEACVASFGMDEVRRAFTLAEESSFLKGGGERGWKARLSWMVKVANMEKILSGAYADRTNITKKSGGSFDTNEFFEAALKRTYGNDFELSQLERN